MALPLVLWSLYVYSVFHTSDVGSRAFSLPLASYAAKWHTTIVELSADGWGTTARYNLCILVSVTVEALYLVWRFNWKNPWWRVGATYALLMTVLGSAVWEGDSSAVARVLLPLAFAFNVLLARERWFWPNFVLGNLAVLHGLATINELPVSRLF